MSPLSSHTTEYQNRVIGRLWAAIGINIQDLEDDLVDQMLEEWANELADLTIEQIDAGRQKAAKLKHTVPADQFRELCAAPAPTEDPEPETVAQQVAASITDEFPETKEESYNRLGLGKRWGPLHSNPKRREKR